MSKKEKLVFILYIVMVIIILAVGAYILSDISAKIEKPVPEIPENPPVIKDYTPDQISNIIERLVICESQNRPRAINFYEKDKIPSFGILQFRFETLKEFGIKYGYFGENVSDNWITAKLFDADLQKRIVRDMLLDKDITEKRLRESLFPTCWDKIKK